MPIDYDPMLGKLVVHAADRAAAIARLARALAEYEIAGVETTLPLFRALVADADFRAGRFDVQWLDRRIADGLFHREEPASEDVLLAAAALASGQSSTTPESARAAGSAWAAAARREALRS